MADNTGYFDTSYDVYDYERYKKKRKFIKQEIYVNYRQIIICSAVLGIIYILYNYCFFNFGMNGENICMSNMYVLYNFIVNLPNCDPPSDSMNVCFGNVCPSLSANEYKSFIFLLNAISSLLHFIVS